MFIYRDEVYHENSDLKASRKLLSVNNVTAQSYVRLTFNGQWSRFDNYAGPQYDGTE